MRPTLRYFSPLWCLPLVGVFTSPPCCGQSFDGAVRNPDQLVNAPAVLRPVKGPPVRGSVTEVFRPEGSPQAIQHLEIESDRGRSRRYRPEQIQTLQIGGRMMEFVPHYPSKTFRLVNRDEAESEVDARFTELGKQRSSLYEEDEHERLTRTAIADLKKTIGKLPMASRLSATEGEHCFFVSDYPPRMQPALARFVDGFIPKLNRVFGFDEEDLVLPGKPVVALFASRDHLGVFQREVANNPNYGKLRAFFQLVDGRVIVTAEDDRSPKHATWQAAWGLAGAYARFSYSSVVLPAWVRVGLQQHCADLCVPGLVNLPDQRARVARELKGGSLNGLLIAEMLPLDRQLVSKFLVAHLYHLDSKAFSQMLYLLKMGKSVEETLELCYGMDPRPLASSFGKTVGIPGLTP